MGTHIFKISRFLECLLNLKKCKLRLLNPINEMYIFGFGYSYRFGHKGNYNSLFFPDF